MQRRVMAEALVPVSSNTAVTCHETVSMFHTKGFRMVVKA